MFERFFAGVGMLLWISFFGYSQAVPDSLAAVQIRGFELHYPAAWKTDRRGSGLVLFPEVIDNHASRDYQLSFVNETVGSSIDVRAYKDRHINQAKTVWKRYGITLEVQEEDTLRIAGLPAWKIICSEQPANQVRIKYIWLYQGRAYRFEYTAPLETYDKYLEEIESVIGSVAIP